MDDLMNLPQVSVRIRERKIEELLQIIRKKEEDFKQRELKLIQRETTIKEKD